MPKQSKVTSTIQHQTLFEFENLAVMQGMADEIIDLIYLDPPFTDDPSQLADATSKKAEDEFKRAWSMDRVKQNWIDQLQLARPALYSIAETAGSTRGEAMRAYMLYMAIRLREMHRILKPTGSIYLHCNPYASHYLKLLMDAIFGESNFRNEIVWHHPKIGIASKKFTSNTDTLLYYTKSADYLFIEQRHNIPNELYNRWKSKIRGKKLYYREAKTINGDAAQSKIRVMSKQLGRNLKDNDVVVDFNLPKNKKAVDNVWKISFLKGNSKERRHVNHPTQKPEALLRRIIDTSSKKGDWVLDPFSGSGTACVVAEDKGRNWIAIEEDSTWTNGFEQRLLQTSPNAKLVKLNTPPTDRKPTRSKDIKKQLYAVQQGKCSLCQVKFELRNLTVDHIVPTSKEGADTDDNLQLLCGACNSVKSQGTQEAAEKKLKAQGVIK